MPVCSLRLQADSDPVSVLVLQQCGLLRSSKGLGACWAHSDVEGDAWSVAQDVFACVGHTVLHVAAHEFYDALHSARVMVLPDTGASYMLEGAGPGRWSLWNPCATEVEWAGASQLGRELPHSCE